jgi:hypothetical protein
MKTSQKEKEKLLSKDSASIESAHYNFEKTKYLDFSAQLFDVTPHYTYLNFLKYFVAVNISITLTLEVLRRIFYYVVLGSLWPRKTEY